MQTRIISINIFNDNEYDKYYLCTNSLSSQLSNIGCLTVLLKKEQAKVETAKVKKKTFLFSLERTASQGRSMFLIWNPRN